MISTSHPVENFSPHSCRVFTKFISEQTRAIQNVAKRYKIPAFPNRSPVRSCVSTCCHELVAATIATKICSLFQHTVRTITSDARDAYSSSFSDFSRSLCGYRSCARGCTRLWSYSQLLLWQFTPLQACAHTPRGVSQNSRSALNVGRNGECTPPNSIWFGPHILGLGLGPRPPWKLFRGSNGALRFPNSNLGGRGPSHAGGTGTDARIGGSAGSTADFSADNTVSLFSGAGAEAGSGSPLTADGVTGGSAVVFACCFCMPASSTRFIAFVSSTRHMSRRNFGGDKIGPAPDGGGVLSGYRRRKSFVTAASSANASLISSFPADSTHSRSIPSTSSWSSWRWYRKKFDT